MLLLLFLEVSQVHKYGYHVYELKNHKGLLYLNRVNMLKSKNFRGINYKILYNIKRKSLQYCSV